VQQFLGVAKQGDAAAFARAPTHSNIPMLPTQTNDNALQLFYRWTLTQKITVFDSGSRHMSIASHVKK
jgi:hypothetical protein